MDLTVGVAVAVAVSLAVTVAEAEVVAVGFTGFGAFIHTGQEIYVSNMAGLRP